MGTQASVSQTAPKSDSRWHRKVGGIAGVRILKAPQPFPLPASLALAPQVKGQICHANMQTASSTLFQRELSLLL